MRCRSASNASRARAIATADRRLNAFWRKPAALMGVPSDAPMRQDFQLGVPDSAMFPFDIWRRLSARALRALSKQHAAYAAPQGQPALREAIARHVSFARAVACRPDDVVVTAGAQQAFDLLARILVTPGRTVVAIENPGYPPMRAAFAAAGAKLAPVRVDGEGLVVERVPRRRARDLRDAVASVSARQRDVGAAPRGAARLRAGSAAPSSSKTTTTASSVSAGGRSMRCRRSIARESVFYVGTFSKSLFPAIRLGFVVAPPWARDALVAAKQCADWHCGVIEQDTLAAFIGEGHLARHVRRMRGVYAARRDALLGALDRDFARWLEPVPNVAGLHLTAFLRPGIDAQTDRRTCARAVDRHFVAAAVLRRHSAFGPCFRLWRDRRARHRRGTRASSARMAEIRRSLASSPESRRHKPRSDNPG